MGEIVPDVRERLLDMFYGGCMWLCLCACAQLRACAPSSECLPPLLLWLCNWLWCGGSFPQASPCSGCPRAPQFGTHLLDCGQSLPPLKRRGVPQGH